MVDFGIGSPDTGTPPALLNRLLTEAREPSNHGYPTSAGLPALREALAAWYLRRFAVHLDAGTQTLATWGASDALAHLPWVLLGPGDAALVPEPCYPIHRYAVQFAGAQALPVPMGGPEAGDEPFNLAAAVEQAWRGARTKPRVLLLSFPHNPTTRCVELHELEPVVAFARRTGLFIVYDLAYVDLAFNGHHPPSILQIPGASEIAVELTSLSKSFNMAGWRLGFVAGNAEVVAGLARLKSYLDYGVSKAVQFMGLEALEGPDDAPRQLCELYRERRDALCDRLTACGWPVARPRGTMFVWARIPPAFQAMGSLAFAEHLVREAHVAVSPGVGFTAGLEVGRGTWADQHVRFALVQPRERVERALGGIAHALARS